MTLPWKFATSNARGQEVGDHSINWTESRGESAEDVIIKNYISKNKTTKVMSIKHHLI